MAIEVCEDDQRYFLLSTVTFHLSRSVTLQSITVKNLQNRHDISRQIRWKIHFKNSSLTWNPLQPSGPYSPNGTGATSFFPPTIWPRVELIL